MADYSETEDGLSLADRATLSLLSTLEDGEPVTQRGLAQRIGVALGLTNSLLKRATRKGLVKVREAPTRRFAYYVTPKGFAEKTRLVAKYLSTSLDFFRRARLEYTALFEAAAGRGLTRVALFGMGELSEIAILSAREAGVELVAVVEPGSNLDSHFGLPVLPALDAAAARDLEAVVVTAAGDPQRAYEALSRHFAEERILTVPLLHIQRRGAEAEAAG